jgi:hypothetical protein
VSRVVDVQTFTQVIAALSIVLGLLGLIILWKKGKTAEGISILNTALLIIVILLLIFPPQI